MSIDIIARGLAASSSGGGGDKPLNTNYIMFGTSTNGTASQSVLDSLQTKTKIGSISRKLGTINCGTGSYIYYAFPSRLGKVKFTQYGVEGGFEGVSYVEYTNDEGTKETYAVYRSSNILNDNVDGIEAIKI